MVPEVVGKFALTLAPAGGFPLGLESFRCCVNSPGCCNDRRELSLARFRYLVLQE